MAVEGGPNIIDDGLVLALDGSNVRSFRGEPTTNVVTNTNLDTGWSKNYNTSIQWNDYPPPDGVNSQVVSFVDSNADGFGYWYSYGDYAPQDPSTTYTISIYARTIGSNWSLEAYTADNSETGRQWTNTLTVPGDGKWYRLVFNSFTTPANTQSDSLSFQFSSIPANQRCWLCAPQMEAKSYATPFVDGTRGTTNATGGGWVDLSGNGRHGELFNGPSYDSASGGIVFDGANDYIELNTNNVITGTNPFTFECWYTITALNSGGEIFGNYGSGYSSANYIWISGEYGVYIGGAVYFPGYPISAGTYHMAVTRASDGTTVLYKNGVAVNSGTLTPSIAAGPNFRIGADTTSAGGVGGERLNGKIYQQRVYNRVLSASEIFQNFGVMRKRFGV